MEDKSLFHYGGIFHKLIDPLNKQTRDKIVDAVSERASILDIGCGTGALCFELRKAKGCRVVGVDLSLRMLEFAERTSPFEDIQFLHRDATNLVDLPVERFDYVVAALVIHELDAEAQQRLVKEAWRVGEKAILADASAPLPWNAVGVVKRILEIGFGLEHYPRFRTFVSNGGIMGILRAVDLDRWVVQRERYSMRSNEMVVIAH